MTDTEMLIRLNQLCIQAERARCASMNRDFHGNLFPAQVSVLDVLVAITGDVTRAQTAHRHMQEAWTTVDEMNTLWTREKETR